MDFETVFPHIFPSKAGGPVRQSPKDEDGFDAIVGNPPYVFTRDVEFGASVKNYYKKNYLDIIEKSERTKGTLELSYCVYQNG